MYTCDLKLVLNLMAKQLLDLSPSKETEEISKAFAVFSKALLSVPIRIPGTSYSRGIKAREFLIKKINEGIKHRRQHPDEAVHNDFLGELLKEDLHSEEVIADLVVFLLFAGHETSASAMVFSIKFLTDCPKALHELKAEHGALLKRKGSPRNQKHTWDDYQSMKFTECVINETLRLANVASALFREAKEDIKIKGGFVIPRGWTVMVLLNRMHLDEKYHSSALTFDPWRWQRQLENNIMSSQRTPLLYLLEVGPGSVQECIWQNLSWPSFFITSSPNSDGRQWRMRRSPTFQFLT